MSIVSANNSSKNCFGRYWPIRKRPYSEIEPAIKPLVDSLNAISGISTVASCEGHFYGGAPYVYFNASVQIAASIERLLREAAIKNQPALMTEWSLDGMFNENYELAFCLRSPEYNRRTNNPLYAFWLFVVRRRKLDSDLAMLAAYFREETILSNVGEVDKPNVSAQGK